MSVILGGLRRLLGAPGWWLGAWLGVAAIAGVVGAQVQVLAAAAVGPFDVLDLERALFGIVDVLRIDRAVGPGLVVTVLAGGLVAGVAWLVLSPLVIARLAGHRGRELGAQAVAGLPGVLVQSAWHVLLRGGLMVVVGLSLRPLPDAVGWVSGTLAWLVAGVALDATRVAVVEREAARWHIKTAWRGLVHVVRRPSVLVPGVLLGLGQLATSGAILWLALAGLGTGSIWAARLLTLVSVGLGLWRLGIVVEDALASDAE